MWTLFDQFTFFPGQYILRPGAITAGNFAFVLFNEPVTYYGLWCEVIPTDFMSTGDLPGRIGIDKIQCWTARHRANIAVPGTFGNRLMSYNFPLRSKLGQRTIQVYRFVT